MGQPSVLLRFLTLAGAHSRADRNADRDASANVIERRAQGNPKRYPHAEILAGKGRLRVLFRCSSFGLFSHRPSA